MNAHKEIQNIVILFVDNVIRYVDNRDFSIGIIQRTLELFDLIDLYYHPEANGVMTEDERESILVKTCDAYRPLLKEQRLGRLTLRDQIALEVFEMVNYWGNDEYFDRLENYPIGPEIDAERS